MQNIGIIGRKRSGKDTAANYLVENFGYVRHGLADPLKDAALALDPIIDADPHFDWLGSIAGIDVKRLSDLVAAVGWERAKDGCPEVRRILQRLGDEAGRQVHGDMTWVNQLMDRVRTTNDAGSPVVVPDVRYWNEAWYLDQVGFTLVRIDRPGYSDPTPGEHASEQVERLGVHHVVVNDGSTFDLCDEVGRFAGAPVPA